MRPSPLYSFIAALSWPVFRGLFRLRAQGKENLPADGGFVLAANHLSNLDPWPLALPLWPKRFLRFMAKSELYWWPLTAVLNRVGAFPVRRGQRDVVAIETAVRLGRVNVAYGAPVDLDDLRGREAGEAAQEATERLMARIAELEASL